MKTPELHHSSGRWVDMPLKVGVLGAGAVGAYVGGLIALFAGLMIVRALSGAGA